jgi:hypothetical protein
MTRHRLTVDVMRLRSRSRVNQSQPSSDLSPEVEPVPEGPRECLLDCVMRALVVPEHRESEPEERRILVSSI